MSGHLHDLRAFEHSHSFGEPDVQRRQRALTQVTLITFAVMLLELLAGWWSGSLALLADGWHMGTHALALGGAVLAYRLAARANAHAAYAFGGWKIEVLTAYTSGLMLLLVALWIAADALATLRAPHAIAYQQAMAVAVFGLAVNLASAWLLARGATGGHAGHHHGHGHGHGHEHEQVHGHGHGHGHGHDHGHEDAHDHGRAQPQHDHNFRAAYVHVLADALTSVLAIGALAGGLLFGWRWLDPAVALAGALIIGQWALSVLRASATALVDATADPTLSQRVRALVEADGDARVADLHVWQVGARAWSAALSIVADQPLPASTYRERLQPITKLRHVTVEVHRCPGAAPTTQSPA